MTTNEKRIKFFRDFCRLVCIAYDEKGIQLLPTEFHRTQQRQDALFEDGKTETHHSDHQDWLAIDAYIVRNGKIVWEGDDPDYEWLGTRWIAWGHKWGGAFKFSGKLKGKKDSGHFGF